MPSTEGDPPVAEGAQRWKVVLANGRNRGGLVGWYDTQREAEATARRLNDEGFQHRYEAVPDGDPE